MSLSGNSKIFGVLGDPIAHSLSPLMHNFALERYGIDAVYVPFHVTPASLSAAVVGLRALNIAGFNVTIPHKEAILPLLDQIDPVAQLIGAVNTVVNDDGILTGFNTDASGFMRAVQAELNFIPKNKQILFLGAGGASRAAIAGLAKAGIKSIVIANRNIKRAIRLVADMTSCFPTVCFSAVGYGSNDYIEAVSSADLIVNATSVGLNGEDVDILPLENVKSSALMFDMVYSFALTPFVKVVREAGLVCTDGLGMLAAQGEDAFYLWTGVRLPTGFMRDYLLKSK